jgi:Tfp pilus assembly protein PilV
MVARERESGMTLLEVMVALVVSTIGIFGMLALLGLVMKGGDYSRRITEASVLAQYKLEELVVLPWASMAPLDAATCPSAPASTAFQETTINALGGAPTGSQPTYGRGWQWCTITAAPARRRVVVAVTWIDNTTGATHQVVASRDRAQ